jgi:hypothetical protein
LTVGTDVLPLLENFCFTECTQSLPSPHPNYVRHTHRGGGTSLAQPLDAGEMMRLERPQTQEVITTAAGIDETKKQNSSQQAPLLKVIWKLWQK